MLKVREGNVISCIDSIAITNMNWECFFGDNDMVSEACERKL